MRTHFALPVLFVTLSSVGLCVYAQRSTQPKPTQKLSLAFVTNNPSDYWTVARKGVEKAEKELGINVEFQLPPSGTAAEQAQIVKELLAKKVNGIAISPVAPMNQTDLINSTAAKALVFTQNSDVPNSKRTCFIGTDNVAAGRQAGEELKRRCLKAAR